MKIIIFHTNIIRVGGIETFTYNMAKQLSLYYDVEVIYKTCHPEQLKRLHKFVKCEAYDEKKTYTCDICIIACAWGGYPYAILAKEYWQTVHANYKEIQKRENWSYQKWAKTTRHIAVSKSVAKNFKELYNIDCTVIYNILDDIQPRTLNLLSAMRYSPEKGCKRMEILANALKANGIPFHWKIFTPKSAYPNAPYMDIPEVEYLEPKYNIYDEMRLADYGVQLSDTEGYSYFINECLQYRTPVLVTDFDSAFESVEDGKNGYILPMNMQGIDVEKIYKYIPKNFKYIPKTKVQDWIDIIGAPEKKEEYKPEQEPVEAEIKVLATYSDTLLNRIVSSGETLRVPYFRALILCAKKKAEIVKTFTDKDGEIPNAN